MEWKENFGMDYGRYSEWNGMEDLKNRIEDRPPYLPNSELHISKITDRQSQIKCDAKFARTN